MTRSDQIMEFLEIYLLFNRIISLDIYRYMYIICIDRRIVASSSIMTCYIAAGDVHVPVESTGTFRSRSSYRYLDLDL